ncbi:MAG: YceD family protein [Methylovulum sp.]|nr:YceD family protein [Methylovulum sp.]
MLDRLPEYIDPLHLADKRAELKGKIPISRFERVAEMLHSADGAVVVELVFGREGRLAEVEGHLNAVFELQCQNCLQAVTWPVSHEIKLGIVTSLEQADKLPGDYEPLVVAEEQKIRLKDIVEDELLLVLPLFPKHQYACLNAGITNNVNVSAGSTQFSAENPFSILANLKNTGDL